LNSALRVPVTLLTGFLGSGKTTLINRAIRHRNLARTLVVINEFGEIGLDQSLIVSSDDNIVVLENGCMCCTVRGGLLDTLNDLFASRFAGEIDSFDHLLIETSGLADPVPILQAMLSEPTLEGRYRIARVIATFDAINGPVTLKNHDESVRQIAVADDIIITKADLQLAEPLSEGITDYIPLLRRLNPAARILLAQDSEAEPSKLLIADIPDPATDPTASLTWLNAPAYEGLQHDHNHQHKKDIHLDDVASFCYVKDDPLPREALHLLLRALVNNLGPNLLRVKGLVNILEEPDRPAVIQGAQHLLHNVMWLEKWPDSDHRTRIVFIAQGIARAAVEEMIELLARVATRTANARIRANEVAVAQVGG